MTNKELAIIAAVFAAALGLQIGLQLQIWMLEQGPVNHAPELRV